MCTTVHKDAPPMPAKSRQCGNPAGVHFSWGSRPGGHIPQPYTKRGALPLSSPPESFKLPPVLAFWFMPQALQGSQRPTAVIELCELCSMIDPLASRSVNRRKAWGNTGRGNACAIHTVTPPYFHNEDLYYCQRSR
jgi:hypothetical protein